MRKILGVLLVTFFGILFFGSNKVEAAYLDKKIQVGPSLYLVGTIYADDNGSGYINGSEGDIYTHGVSNLKIQSSSKKLTKFGNGYRLDYRVSLGGEVSNSLTAGFQAYGFSIGASSRGKTYVSKYISGTFYFTKHLKMNVIDGGIVNLDLLR